MCLEEKKEKKSAIGILRIYIYRCIYMQAIISNTPHGNLAIDMGNRAEKEAEKGKLLICVCGGLG